jgi:hypothetical protein
VKRREFILAARRRGGAFATLAARADAKFGVNERAMGNVLRVVYFSPPR